MQRRRHVQRSSIRTSRRTIDCKIRSRLGSSSPRNSSVQVSALRSTLSCAAVFTELSALSPRFMPPRRLLSSGAGDAHSATGRALPGVIRGRSASHEVTLPTARIGPCSGLHGKRSSSFRTLVARWLLISPRRADPRLLG
eukprot:scaffold125191_cov39-Phaeocystis_antarctica.AAC.3